ncbi:MAG: 3-coathanger stack domain-containing protein [Bacteroidota bacterium]
MDNTELHAADTLIVANNQINEGAVITFQAGESITLKSGFHAKAGTDFTAKIGDCPKSGFETDGFVQRSNAAITYDLDGNMTTDPNKRIVDIKFNYQHRPYEVTWENGNKIEWLWSGDGEKLQRLTRRNGTVIGKLDYIGQGIEYENDTLARIYLEDAKLTFDKGVIDKYRYFLKGHLMSSRVVFSEENGLVVVHSEHHSYPFGLAFEGDFTKDLTTKRLYNFKENISDFGLGWSDFGERFYLGGAVPRFLGVDPISEKFAHLSVYNYASNDPVSNVDLHGLQGVKAITAVGRILLRAVTTVGRVGVKRGVSEAIKGEGAEIKADAQTLISPDASFEDRAAALYDLVIGIGDLNVNDANVVTDIPIVKAEGDEEKEEKANDSSKNEKHGDRGRAKSKAEKQIEELESQLDGANKKEKNKIKKKIQNIKRDAAKKAKGEEHSRTKKR